MDLKQLVMLGLQVSIVCTVFGYGLKTTTAALLFVVRRPVLLARSLLCVLVIVPALAFAIASANFQDQRFGGAIILYLILSVLIGVPYVRWNRWRVAQ